MRQLVSVDKKDVWNIEHSNESYVQLSLADFWNRVGNYEDIYL